MVKTTVRNVKLVAPEKIYEKENLLQSDKSLLLSMLRQKVTDYQQILNELELQGEILPDSEQLQLMVQADEIIVSVFNERHSSDIQSAKVKIAQQKKDSDRIINRLSKEIIEKTEESNTRRGELALKNKLISDLESICNSNNSPEIIAEVAKGWRVLGFKSLADWLDSLSEKLENWMIKTDIELIADSDNDPETITEVAKGWRVLGFKLIADWLDNLSEKIKKIAHLENSQASLRYWNDMYRIQQSLSLKLLEKEGIDLKFSSKIVKIHGIKSISRTIEYGKKFLDMERSDVLKWLKSLQKGKKIKYIKNLPEE
jgi:hypothetical protein